MKRLYYLIAVLYLLAGSIYAQNPDSLKHALVRSKSVPFSNQPQTYYPEMDCVGAIPICTDTIISNNVYIGHGYYNDIDSTQSCLSSGEYNGAWYKIFITQDGYLGFNIIPNDSLEDDYDWAVFNLTNVACSNLYGDIDLLARCSFSSWVGATGAYPDTIDPTIAIYFNDKLKIPVLQNEVYYLLISFYRDNSSPYDPTKQSGYLINFSYSTFPLDSCLQQVITNILDDKNKADVLLYPNPAGNTITLTIPDLKQGQTAGIAIYNTTGVLVKQQPGLNQPENQLDITNLPAGLYYYIVQTPYGQNSGRFVKE